MAYFMLDLLFLIGDPKKSHTLLDDPSADGHYTVGEAIPPQLRNLKKPKVDEPFTESRVRIDRTSQLLVALSITIAEYVKMYHLRNKDEKREEKIRQLSGFEDIVRSTIIDKSTLLTRLLSVEIIFFAKKNNEKIQQENPMNVIINRKNQKDPGQE